LNKHPILSHLIYPTIALDVRLDKVAVYWPGCLACNFRGESYRIIYLFFSIFLNLCKYL